MMNIGFGCKTNICSLSENSQVEYDPDVGLRKRERRKDD